MFGGRRRRLIILLYPLLPLVPRRQCHFWFFSVIGCVRRAVHGVLHSALTWCAHVGVTNSWIAKFDSWEMCNAISSKVCYLKTDLCICNAQRLMLCAFDYLKCSAMVSVLTT